MFEVEGIIARYKECGFTPAELRVALLVLKGYTNQEMADTLFVTPKTIRFHTSSIYRRSKMPSRAKFIVWSLYPKLLAPHDITFEKYLK